MIFAIFALMGVRGISSSGSDSDLLTEAEDGQQALACSIVSVSSRKGLPIRRPNREFPKREQAR